MFTKIVNCTAHILNIHREDGSILDIHPSGRCPRVTATTVAAVTVQGIAVMTTTYGEVVGLPDPIEGVLFVVSGMVRAASPERTDLASPGPLLRDADNQPCGCKGLAV